MDLNFIFPLILFAISIIFSLIVQNIKAKGISLNELKKNIKVETDKALKSLEAKNVQVEEQLNVQKLKADEVFTSVENKLTELNSHGEELAQLLNSLNKYRSMLMQLDVSTNNTYDWVLKVQKDSERLQEIQKLIETMEKKTVEILTSFEEGVKKQQVHFETFANEINTLSRNNKEKLEFSRNEILTEVKNCIESLRTLEQEQTEKMNQFSASLESLTQSGKDVLQVKKDDVIKEVEAQIEILNGLKEEHQKIQSEQNQLLEQTKQEQLKYNKGLEETIKNFETEKSSIIDQAKANMQNDISSIIDDTKGKISSINDEFIKNYETGVDKSTEDKLLKVDETLQKTINVINQYTEERSKPEISEVVEKKQVLPKEEIKKSVEPIVKKPVIKQEEIIGTTKEEKKEIKVPFKDIPAAKEVSKKEIKEPLTENKNIKEEKAKILHNSIPPFTGFGSLLNSYESLKKTPVGPKEKPKDTVYKPGSILTEAVAQKQEKKEYSKVEEVEKKAEPKTKKTEKEEVKIEKNKEEEKKYIPTGDEEEILLD